MQDPKKKKKFLIDESLQDPITAQAIAAAYLKTAPRSPGGTIYLKQELGGGALPVTIGRNELIYLLMNE